MEKIENPFINFPNYNCFACSPANPWGLKLDFYKDTDSVVSYFHPAENYSGLPKVMHGGIAGVLMDELMFWAIFVFLEKIAFTTSIEVKYKKYIPTDERIIIRGKIVENKRRFFRTIGEICNNGGELLAQAEGVYFAANLSTLQKSFGLDYFPDAFIKYCEKG